MAATLLLPLELMVYMLLENLFISSVIYEASVVMTWPDNSYHGGYFT